MDITWQFKFYNSAIIFAYNFKVWSKKTKRKKFMLIAFKRITSRVLTIPNLF